MQPEKSPKNLFKSPAFDFNTLLLPDFLLQLDLELTRTVQMATDYSKNCAKGERRVKELQFQSEENQKNRDRIGELIDKLQQKIRQAFHVLVQYTG